MSFKIIIILFFPLSFYYTSFAQIESLDNTCCCRINIEQLSEGWKKDSLASDGFRLTNYKKLLTCEIDSISIDFLLKKLGEPGSRGVSKKEISFIYYFFDRNNISKKNWKILLESPSHLIETKINLFQKI